MHFKVNKIPLFCIEKISDIYSLILKYPLNVWGFNWLNFEAILVCLCFLTLIELLFAYLVFIGIRLVLVCRWGWWVNTEHLDSSPQTSDPCRAKRRMLSLWHSHKHVTISLKMGKKKIAKQSFDRPCVSLSKYSVLFL